MRRPLRQPRGAALSTPPTPDQLADQLGELAVLWPALPYALARDSGTTSGERVHTTPSVHAIPLNAAVADVTARLAREIPATAAWAARAIGQQPNHGRSIPDHLRHLAPAYGALLAQHRTRDAARLAAHIGRWHAAARDAFGLDRPDRPIGSACPLHDTPLTTLMEPGERGWLRYEHLDHSGQPIGVTIEWTRAQAIYCPHCGAVWAANRWMWLRRLIAQAEQERAAAAAKAAAEAAAATTVAPDREDAA